MANWKSESIRPPQLRGFFLPDPKQKVIPVTLDGVPCGVNVNAQGEQQGKRIDSRTLIAEIKNAKEAMIGHIELSVGLRHNIPPVFTVEVLATNPDYAGYTWA